MKILYIVTSADLGGAQTYTLQLAKYFGGIIGCGIEHDWLFEEAKRLGIETIRLKHLKRDISPYHDLAAYFELRKVIAEVKPDLIHLNSSKAGVIGSFAAKKSSIPVIYTVHGLVLNEALSALKKSFYGFLERRAARRRAYTIAVSQEDYNGLLSSKCASAEKMQIIHNGIPAMDFLGKQAARQQLGLPADGLCIGTIANLYPNKGVDILIQAAAKLSPDILEKITMIAIIGEGPQREKLEKMVTLQGLSKVIKFCGAQKSAARLLKAFDIFVLPSRKEGMPFAILEAMQAGLPIIATDVGGVAETLGQSAIVVSSESPESIEKGLRGIIIDPILRQHFGEAALLRAAEFTDDKMFNETGIIYKLFLAS